MLNPPLGRYDNVRFHFLGSDEDSRLSGFVIVRPDEMLIHVSEGDDSPYELPGIARHTWYEGENTNPSRRYETRARWACVGDLYVGQWVEDGWEYLFSFHLGKPTG